MIPQTRIGMPLDEFLSEQSRQPFELVNGERIAQLPNVFGHAEVIQLLFLLLFQWTQTHRTGRVFSETTFILSDRQNPDWVTGSRIPDLMVYAGDRIDEYKAHTPDYREKPLALVPDLVIEGVSPSDKVGDLDDKIDAYLSDGVRLIWVLKPQRGRAVVYAPDMEQPLHLSGDAVLDASEVLPGFQVRLTDIFGE